MTGDPWCEVHGQLPCVCTWNRYVPSENNKNINPWGLVKPVYVNNNKGNLMEDKYLSEVMSILKVSVDNPFIKDQKKLNKIKLDLMKSLVEKGINLPIA